MGLACIVSLQTSAPPGQDIVSSVLYVPSPPGPRHIDGAWWRRAWVTRRVSGMNMCTWTRYGGVAGGTGAASGPRGRWHPDHTHHPSAAQGLLLLPPGTLISPPVNMFLIALWDFCTGTSFSAVRPPSAVCPAFPTCAPTRNGCPRLP